LIGLKYVNNVVMDRYSTRFIWQSADKLQRFTPVSLAIELAPIFKNWLDMFNNTGHKTPVKSCPTAFIHLLSQIAPSSTRTIVKALLLTQSSNAAYTAKLSWELNMHANIQTYGSTPIPLVALEFDALPTMAYLDKSGLGKHMWLIVSKNLFDKVERSSIYQIFSAFKWNEQTSLVSFLFPEKLLKSHGSYYVTMCCVADDNVSLLVAAKSTQICQMNVVEDITPPPFQYLRRADDIESDANKDCTLLDKLVNTPNTPISEWEHKVYHFTDGSIIVEVLSPMKDFVVANIALQEDNRLTFLHDNKEVYVIQLTSDMTIPGGISSTSSSNSSGDSSSLTITKKESMDQLISIQLRCKISTETAACACCSKKQQQGVKLSQCSGCKQVLYCSRECQLSHWKEHKLVCKKK
jgi:hypothetical protein